jgi:ankyrin repeat protein
LPHHEYLSWGGKHEDVVLTFPEPPDARSVQQFVDLCAYVPRPNAHLMFIPKNVLGDASRSEMAAQRVVPGSELTSSHVEKEFGRIVDFLIRAGVDCNQGDIDGVTPLMIAAKFGLLFILRKLLARGADAMATDARGNSALHYARAFVQLTAAQILQEHTLSADGGADGSEEPVSVLDTAPNADGRLPSEVEGEGILIFPEPAERMLFVSRIPKKSDSLAVSRVI